MKNLIPGKTFLAGEYSVLLNGDALGLATRPCFEVVSGSAEHFHPLSPAGRYLARFANSKNPSVHLQDPYQALGIQGGFGRSTAEFLAVLDETTKLKEFSEIRKIYLDLHQGEKLLPSGADLAFQYFGKICWAQLKEERYQSFDWPFEALHFFVVATGFKVATHQHLAELELKKIEHLPRESHYVIESFFKKDPLLFLETLTHWADVLESAALTLPHSVDLRRALEKQSDILLVKPCGALGADVVLVFCQNDKRMSVQATLLNLRLQIVAEVKDICQGVGPHVG